MVSKTNICTIVKIYCTNSKTSDINKISEYFNQLNLTIEANKIKLEYFVNESTKIKQIIVHTQKQHCTILHIDDSIINKLLHLYNDNIYGIINYSFEEYETDIYNAICYVPFFTSIWFGTIPQDELIDKNFPYFFIKKMFYLLELIK